MIHIVRPHESLWSIALSYYGDGEKWRKIAADNRLANPALIFVGQPLTIDGATRHTGPVAAADGTDRRGPRSTSLVPGKTYVWVLADEINPLRQKVVRHVLVNPRMAAESTRNLGRPVRIFPNPERFGFHPTDPTSPLSLGRHAQGMKPSPYLSASTRPFGASRFTGPPFWIDVEAARRAGATLYTTEAICADLDRIAAKTHAPDTVQKINQIKRLVQADREVLWRGDIPAAVIKSTPAMVLTRLLQGVQIIGITMTGINLALAAQQSLRMHSVRPVAAETLRQTGGWASCWAGMELGAAGGALVGIETGPGAIITSALGSLVGGVAGYFGFDWIADHISEN